MHTIKKLLSLLTPVLLVVLFSVGPMVVMAQQANPANSGANTLPANQSYNQQQANSGYNSDTSLKNPLGSKASSICQLVKLLLKAVMVIGIPIAVLFIVYAGFKFVVAQGSPGEISEARANLLNVIIGIAIFLGASLIADVILNTLKGLGATGVGSC